MPLIVNSSRFSETFSLEIFLASLPEKISFAPGTGAIEYSAAGAQNMAGLTADLVSVIVAVTVCRVMFG